MQTINWKTVIGQLQRETRLIDVEANKERIKSLINRAALRLTSSEWLVHKEETITIQNGIGKLPCDLIRVLRMFDNSGYEINPSRIGEHIKPNFKTGSIRIHYYAVPTEEVDGEILPMLLYEYMDWYVWYIIYTFMRDDWLEGKLPSDRWAWIEQEYDNAYDSAMGSIELLSMTDLEEQLYMMRNGIFFDNS